MKEKRSFYLLIIIMSVVALITMGVTNVILYQVAFEEKSQSLIQTAQSQARLIEAIARYNRRTNRIDWEVPVGERGPTSLLSERAAADTIAQLRDAHTHYSGFGKTGEFVIAGIEAEEIVFLLRHRHEVDSEPKSLPLYSEEAEPMRRALFAQSGILVGKDYRGVEVLAAYEPVDVLNFGIVAKIDMSEIRAPFIKAVLITSAISLIVILIASFLFRRVTNPIVETIRNSEKKYRSLVEEINEWVWATDEHGVLTYSSPQIESMLGIGFSEAVGRRLDDLFHPNQETTPYQKQNMNAIFRNRTVSEYEVDVLDSEGMPVCLLFSAHPIYEEEELIGYQGIAFDITERKEAERLRLEYQETLEKQVQVRTEELHEINEELKRFTYIVSHDLRSPLVSIVGFASEIRQDIGSLQTPKTFEVLSETDQQIVDHVIPESLDYIEAATSKMDGLIKNILQLSRIGQRELQFEPVSCQQVVKRNLKALGYQLESAKVTLSELPEIESDATAIEQIFGNLLGNAVKFCDPKRDLEIAIWAEQGNDTVSFFIRDNGLGIAEKDIPFIFDLFKRVGDHTTQGEGMGLAYVQTLVRKLGGKIACTSNLGLGTTFKVVLPFSSKALN